MKPGTKPIPVVDRILRRCEITAGGCLVFNGSRVTGYGQVRVNGTSKLVHRVMYEARFGPVPSHLDLDHLCRNRACCRPEHLEPVTRRENARRGLKGALTTHCPSGHAYDEPNTYVTKTGHRQCRQCHARRENDRNRRRHG